MELKNIILESLDELNNQDSQENDTKITKDSKTTKDDTTKESTIKKNAIDNILKEKIKSIKSMRNNAILESNTNLESSADSSFKSTKPLSLNQSKIKTGKVISPNNAKTLFNPQDIEFMENLREKLLVLFEGLKIAENQDDKRRMDLVINFLKYELSLIEEFLEQKSSSFESLDKTPNRVF